jgi:hypothetical protein
MNQTKSVDILTLLYSKQLNQALNFLSQDGIVTIFMRCIVYGTTRKTNGNNTC